MTRQLELVETELAEEPDAERDHNDVESKALVGQVPAWAGVHGSSRLHALPASLPQSDGQERAVLLAEELKSLLGPAVNMPLMNRARSGAVIGDVEERHGPIVPGARPVERLGWRSGMLGSDGGVAVVVGGMGQNAANAARGEARRRAAFS